MAGLAVVLDANILIRFAIGRQVPRLLATYAATVDFLAPDTAFVEAKRNLPTILHARGHPGVGEAATLAALDAAADIITAVPASSYESMRSAAMASRPTKSRVGCWCPTPRRRSPQSCAIRRGPMAGQLCSAACLVRSAWHRSDSAAQELFRAQ